jgi:hypothetical protein
MQMSRDASAKYAIEDIEKWVNLGKISGAKFDA